MGCKILIGTQYVVMLAGYNQWQNESIYAAANALDDAERRKDKGAFFGSIHSTLSHLIWGDRIWMNRFSGSEKPIQPNIEKSVEEVGDWVDLVEQRVEMDQNILEWSKSLSEAELKSNLTWFSGAIQAEVSKPLWILVTHFFNHQTHHRGQVHSMLTSAGVQPADTDLFMLPERYLS